MSAVVGGLLSHHVCFAVDDLERAAVTMARGLGAGPFFLMPHRPFDELVGPDGEPCSWEHEHAFGLLGGRLVELTRTDAASPPALAAALARRPVNHVAYLAPDLDAASAGLVAAGASVLLRARRGPIALAYHEVPGLGCVELLQQTGAHDALAAALADAAAGWDGSRPFRAESPL